VKSRKGKIHLIGHAHIDFSWLWPRSETITQVCPLTFKNALNLLRKFPDYYFTQSSAQMYEWMEEFFPEIFEGIKEKVKEGRWEIVGGSWDEHNSNIPCGESLVRQYLYGKRYFRDKFGVDVKVAWLPDVFGYCWSLPQILKKSGIDYFLTLKLKWQIERNDPPLPFPFHIFRWEAPDGSSVLSYHTVAGYSPNIKDDVIKKESEEIKRIHNCDIVMVPFGKGDHGGGPTESMVKNGRSLQKRKDMPEIIFSTAEKFFEELKDQDKTGNFPVHSDELYLKTHRGTLTTDSQVKRDNRKGEILLLNAELFSSIAKEFGYSYPHNQITENWKRLLYGQVHDNLDGSSVAEVYEDAFIDYHRIIKETGEILDAAIDFLAHKITTGKSGKKAIILFNPLSWTRNDVISINMTPFTHKGFPFIIDENGKEIPSQMTGDNNLLFIAEDLPPVGYKIYYLDFRTEKKNYDTDLKLGSRGVENTFFNLKIDRTTGCINEIYDKINKRQVLDEQGKGNILYCFEDKPPDAPKGEPAWNIYPGEKTELLHPEDVEIVENGPVRIKIRIVKKFGSSSFKQEILIYRNINQIDLYFEGDWHERYKFLKVAFPVNIENSYATYEIPFGVIQRFDHSLASPLQNELEFPERKWEEADKAKFENAALKWIDFTDKKGDYGITLLNDSKYGFCIDNNEIIMSLLRSPRRGYPGTPNQWSDQSGNPIVGTHKVRYALYPHKGDWRDASTVNKGFEFNYPVVMKVVNIHEGELPSGLSLFSIEPENVILTALKKCEDEDCLVLRFYESSGKPCKAVLKTFRKPRKVMETDLIEWDTYIKEKKSLSQNTIELDFGKFEIKTIKMYF